MLLPKFLDESDISGIRETLALKEYQYIRSIGRGGFASVHLVKSLKYNEQFAVKLIDNNKIPDSIMEIDTLMKLEGTNIIRMYEYFQDSNFLYIILEYCPGGSMDDMIKNSGPIPEQQLYFLCSKLLHALHQCHANNIAHRDIKPANVLLDAYGRPKLCDFGLSQLYTEKLENTNFAGSVAFMCPRLIEKTAYDPFEADIWALGVTFYYFAYARLPWQQNDLKTMQNQIRAGEIRFPNEPEYNNEFKEIIRRMVEIDPHNRATLGWLLEQPVFNRPTLNLQKSRSKISMLSQFQGQNKEDSLITRPKIHAIPIPVPAPSKRIQRPLETSNCTGVSASTSFSKRPIKYLIRSITPQPLMNSKSMQYIKPDFL